MMRVPKPPHSEPHRILIAFTVACAFLMQAVDTTLLTIAIPSIARDLGQSPLSLHLLVTAYLASLAVFMPVAGWFADRFGARRVFVGAVVLFMAGSMLAAAMPDLWTMLPCRMLQGFGGAMMTPVGRMIVLRAFGPGRTLDGMTWLTVPVLIGPLVGPVIGAALIEVAPWRVLFFVNLPVAAAAILGALTLIQPMPPVPAGRFDLQGFLLAGLSLVLFQAAVELMAHPVTGLAGAGLAALAGLAVFTLYRRHARRTARPALDLSLFANRTYRIAVVAGGIGRVGLNSMSFLLPLFLQLGLGFRPIHAGLLAALAALGALASKALLKRLIRLFGYARVLVGIALAGSGGMAVFAFLDGSWPLPVLIVLVILAGTVRTLFFNAVNALTYAGLQDGELSRAVSSAGVFQQLTMGLGISVSAAILARLQGAEPLSVAHFHLAFAMMAAIPLAAIPFLLGQRDLETATRRPHRPHHPIALRKPHPGAENMSFGEAVKDVDTGCETGSTLAGPTPRHPEHASQQRTPT